MFKNLWLKISALPGRDKRIFWIIAGTGLLLRLIYFYEFSFLAHFPFAIGPDVQEYWERAVELSKGTLFPPQPEIHAPLYSIFLAVCIKIFAASIPFIRLLQLLLNWGAYTAIAKLIDRGGRATPVALWFLGFAMFTPVLFFHQAELISESLFAPLLAGFFFAVDRGGKERRWFLAAGAWLGGLLLTHGLMIFFLAAEFFLFLRRKLWKEAGLLAAGAALVIFPVIAAKTVFYEKLTGIQVNSVFNLWIGHNPDSTGGCYLRQPEWGKRLDKFRREAAEKGVSESRLMLTDIGRFYMDQPKQILFLPVKKLLLLTSFREEIAGADPECLIRKTVIQKVGAGMMAAVLLMAVCGIGFAVKYWEKGYIHFYLLAGSIGSGLLLTVVSGRYRQGMLPGVLLLAALGAYYLGKKAWLLIIPLVIAGGVIIPLTAGGVGDAASITGEAYYRKKEWDIARSYLKTAALSDNHPERYENMLGAIAEEQGDYSLASTHYSNAIQKAPDDADGFLNLGHLYFYRFPLKREMAVMLIKNALARKDNLPSAYDMLGQHLAQQGDFAAALEMFENACRFAPDSELYQKKVMLCRKLAAEKREREKK